MFAINKLPHWRADKEKISLAVGKAHLACLAFNANTGQRVCSSASAVSRQIHHENRSADASANGYRQLSEEPWADLAALPSTADSFEEPPLGPIQGFSITAGYCTNCWYILENRSDPSASVCLQICVRRADCRFFRISGLCGRTHYSSQ